MSCVTCGKPANQRDSVTKQRFCNTDCQCKAYDASPLLRWLNKAYDASPLLRWLNKRWGVDPTHVNIGTDLVGVPPKKRVPEENNDNPTSDKSAKTDVDEEILITLNNIPNEIILHIMSWLNVEDLKSLREIDTQMAQMLRMREMRQKFRWIINEENGFQFSISFASWLPLIEKVTTDSVKILYTLYTVCKNLKDVKFTPRLTFTENETNSGKWVGYLLLLQFLTFGSNLETLTLDFVNETETTRVVYNPITALENWVIIGDSKPITQLQHLRLYLTNPRDKEPQVTLSDNLKDIALFFPNLKSFEYYNSHLEFDELPATLETLHIGLFTEASTAHILRAAETCPLLRELTLNFDSSNPDGEDHYDLLSHDLRKIFPSLQKLVLQGIAAFQESILDMLPENLRYLELGQGIIDDTFDDEPPLKLDRLPTKLETLNILMPQWQGPLQYLPTSLKYLRFIPHEGQVVDLRQFSNLVEIDVRPCERERIDRVLLYWNNAPNLRRIVFGDNESINR